jgi:hypothetical protein
MSDKRKTMSDARSLARLKRERASHTLSGLLNFVSRNRLLMIPRLLLAPQIARCLAATSLALSALLWPLSPSRAQPAAMPQTDSPAKTFAIAAKPNTDITAQIQAAIDDAITAGGGTIQLPNGRYLVSDTLKFAGTLAKFPKGGVPLILRGGPTRLVYKGAPNRTLLDMEAPNQSTLSDIIFDGDNVAGTVGIRYRAGYERGTNGGKANHFHNLTTARFDVGLWIGDPFAPDLVGSSFTNLRSNYNRIGVLVEGGNVAGMSFYNPLISGREAAIKLVGHTARLIRRTPQDPIPPQEIKGESSVLVSVQNGEEIFEKDVPEYALKYRGFIREYQGKDYYWAGGGAPEIAVFNANFNGEAAHGWIIDCNFGHIRLYTARVEGGQNFYRKTVPIASTRFSDVLFDVDVTSFGGTHNVIEYNNPGPLYIYGGDYHGQIALGDNTKVYGDGVRFEKRSPVPAVMHDLSSKEAPRLQANRPKGYPGLLPPGYVLPPDSRVRRTGQKKPLPSSGLAYDVVEIDPVENVGFVQMAGTGGAQVLGADSMLKGTQKVAAGEAKVLVAFAKPLPNNDYQVTVAPNFDSGNFWVSDKTTGGFALNFKTVPAAQSSADWTVQYNPVFPAGTK